MPTYPSDPRGDLSQVDEEVCKDHLWEIVKILDRDQNEGEIAHALRDYVRTYLNPHPEEWIRVNDLLAQSKILTKAQLKAVLSLTLEADISDGHLRNL